MRFDIKNVEWPERRRMHEKVCDEISRQQTSDSEAYDRALLTLSSAFLGFSIAFLRDPNGSTLAHGCLLVGSWFCFCGSIVITIAAFMHNQFNYQRLIEATHTYYLECKEEGQKTVDQISGRTRILNLASGIAFVAGVFLTLVFAMNNFPRTPPMAEETKVMPAAPETRAQPLNVLRPAIPVAEPVQSVTHTEAQTPAALSPSPAQAPAAPAADASDAGGPKQ